MDDDRAPRPDPRPYRPGPPGAHPFPGAYPPPSPGPYPFPGAYPAPGPAQAGGPFPAPQPPHGHEPAGAELGWRQAIGSPARFVASALLGVVVATQLLAVGG